MNQWRVTTKRRGTNFEIPVGGSKRRGHDFGFEFGRGGGS